MQITDFSSLTCNKNKSIRFWLVGGNRGYVCKEGLDIGFPFEIYEELWGQGFLKKIAIDYPNVERLFNGFKSLDLLLKLPKWYPVPRVWFTTITTKTLKEKEIFYILFYIHISIFWMANKKKLRKAFSKQCW